MVAAFLSAFVVPLQAAVATPELTRSCQEHLLSAVENKNLVVDLGMGILSVESYDSETDKAMVRFKDLHRTYRPEKGRTKKAGMYSQALFEVGQASQRILAEMGHPDSVKLVHERTQKLLGLKRSGLFFAQVGLTARLNASELWANVVLFPAIERVNLQRQQQGAPLIKRHNFLMEHFISNPDANSPEAVDMVSVLREIYLATGENLVRSGLLRDYSQGYHRNWRRSGESEGNRGTLRVVQPTKRSHVEFIPQDIDHYVRSFLWARSDKLFGLESISQTLPQTVESHQQVSDVLDFYRLNRIVTLDVGYVVPEFMTRVKTLLVQSVDKKSEWVPDAFAQSTKWRRIYEVAGTLKIAQPDLVHGQIILLVRSPSTSDYRHAEMLRALYDLGAVRVLQIVLDEKETSSAPVK